MAQPTFTEAYGSQPANPSKGSWLARVSHRASHIPNHPIKGPGGASRDSLPLRTPGTAGFVAPDQLPVPQRTASYPTSPIGPDSPAETEFSATPIDPTFGDRTQSPAHNDRAVSQPRQRTTRRGTVTQSDISRNDSEEKMDKYATHGGNDGYDSEADADDEFERGMFNSSSIPEGYDDEDDEDDDDVSDHPSDEDEDDDERDSLGGEDTPTTQGWGDREGHGPSGKMTEWTEEDVAEYLSGLSSPLKQYVERFVEEGVSGEVLVSIGHEELRELGVASAGHRLTILKAVYEHKTRSGVRLEEGDYAPLSTEGEKSETTATQEDITRIIESIRLRDQRIIAAEAELRAMRQDLDRLSEENKKLREETLPVMRLMKDQRTPLPDPSTSSPREPDAPRLQQQLPQPPSQQLQQLQQLQHQSLQLQDPGKGSSLSRKFSKRINPMSKDVSKQNSPIMSHSPGIRDDGQPHLEASAAALAASSHLTASMTNSSSPNQQQLSPTSPAYTIPLPQPPPSASYYQPPTAMQRTFPRDGTQSARPNQQTFFSHNDDSNGSGQWSANNLIHDVPHSARLPPTSSRRQPTPSPREDESQSSRAPTSYGSSSTANAASTSAPEKDNPQVEIFKSFRVSIDDPCRVVLPVALKRYNITDDWRQYALYIVHGDMERCLGLDEKPLMLFKQLDREGRKPMFMLRRHASPQEGWSSSTANSAAAAAAAGAANTGGQQPQFDAAGVSGQTRAIPGGVL